jgi:anti-sigma B factor antagonist
MKIHEREANGITILELEGRFILDEGDAPFRDCISRLIHQGRVKIIVDMKKVTRLDSAGIGMLVAKYVSVYTRGGHMKLLNLTVRGETLIGVTNLYTVFDIFESEEEAIHSFSLDPSKQARPPV